MRYAGRCLSTAVLFSAVFCLVFTGCGGGSSSPATASGEGSSPSAAATPVVSSIAPANVPAGSAAITLTVTGSNFQSDSVIEVDGTKEATSFVNSGELTTTAACESSGVRRPIASSSIEWQCEFGCIEQSTDHCYQSGARGHQPYTVDSRASVFAEDRHQWNRFCTNFCTAVER